MDCWVFAVVVSTSNISNIGDCREHSVGALSLSLGRRGYHLWLNSVDGVHPVVVEAVRGQLQRVAQLQGPRGRELEVRARAGGAGVPGVQPSTRPHIRGGDLTKYVLLQLASIRTGLSFTSISQSRMYQF